MAYRQWLQRVATSYLDSDRVYKDADHILTSFNGITMKTDQYTFEDGRQQVLLCLKGTIPIAFRQNTYNIPVEVWLPIPYPREPPMAFVKPTAQMMIRPGKHVDMSGRIYHPFLFYWTTRPEVTLADFFRVMQEIFSAEPPVFERSQAAAAQSATQNSSYGASSSYQSNPIIQIPRPLQPGSTPPPVPPPPPTTSASRPSQPPQPPPPPANSAATTGFASSLYGSISGIISSAASSLPVSLGYGTSPDQLKTGSSPQLPPSYIQPSQSPVYNANDGGASVEAAATVNIQSLRHAVIEKLRNEKRKFDARRQIDNLLITNRQLQEGEAQVGEIMRKLKDEEQKVLLNIELLTVKNRELADNVAQIKQQPDPNIDEAIWGTTIVYNQLSSHAYYLLGRSFTILVRLFDLVAEDHAIDDSIVCLKEALFDQTMDLNTFLKHVRTLAREQYMKRALVKKIRVQAKMDHQY
ncbi:UEV domain-containing protein [Cladochytrium replicatum]|nr:UEV domain-containing protein [Cladochytrium replicatum]